MPDFLLASWLGTPVWFWGAFLAIVVVLTAFDLGFLHKEDRELGIAESLKLSVFYITVALLFGVWCGSSAARPRVCNISQASSSRRHCRSTTSS